MILIIQNYEARNRNGAGLAMESILDFKKCWNDVVGIKPDVNLLEFLDLLGRLKKPLGMDIDDKTISYFELSRFAKRVLLSMPTVLSPSVDNDWGREDRFYFPESKEDESDDRNSKKTKIPFSLRSAFLNHFNRMPYFLNYTGIILLLINCCHDFDYKSHSVVSIFLNFFMLRFTSNLMIMTTQNLLMYANLPIIIFSLVSGLNAEKFTFNQVLRAVHRNAILSTRLPDDETVAVSLNSTSVFDSLLLQCSALYRYNLNLFMIIFHCTII